MKKSLLFIGIVAVGIGVANATVRDTSSINRQSANSSGAATVNTRTTTARTADAIPRPGTSTTRATTARTTTATRTAKNIIQTNTTRSATPQKATRTVQPLNTGTNASISRTARTTARAAAISNTTSNTFGMGYNTCRDAYFTCMDQFCAKQNDTYRRCICSPKLATIRSRERQLSQTSDQLQDFKDLNIEAIPKTSAEVKAMLNATNGEKKAANAHDSSDSAKKLSGISQVLSSAKSKALSTQGTLDIAGDINSIWATTDLASGAQIANLTGEALYNVVHNQCADLISDKCSSTSTFNMVISAYGMYIENDCAALMATLDKKYTTANAAIRQVESEMHTARLENYDAHNSTSINDCIAQVRTDITSESACGKDYVHCLDVSGRYLNRDTGEPIYTAEFYQLETSISLNGDVLNNQTNRMIVNELNNKRVFAARGLETCRDLADEVWDEFMRQAITEIYQGQHERIRQVKNECLDVVNKCYDTQSQSLKDFSNIKEQLLLGARLELSEEMCQEKLYACANLYGGGPEGMAELVTTMSTITDQQIAQQCQATLQDYLKEMCSVSNNDSLHSYPFGCRTYYPGNLYSVTTLSSDGDNNDDHDIQEQNDEPQGQNDTPKNYTCTKHNKRYIECKKGYYLANSKTDPTPNSTPKVGNACIPCASIPNKNCTCAGGTAEPKCQTTDEVSLYQKLVRYAQQTCVRPSKSDETLPSNILQDVNVVMDSIRVDMARELAKECERLGGAWIDSVLPEGSETSTLQKFYTETNANTNWGYCVPSETYKAEQGCIKSDGEWTGTICTCKNNKTWNKATYTCE